MKKALFALTLLIVVSLACGSSAPDVKTVDDYMSEYGGNPDVYNRILLMTDCALLQNEFNQADANTKLHEPGTEQYKWSLGYMTASDDRMKALNCYGQSNAAPVANTQISFSPTVYLTATIFFLPTLTKPVLSTPITIPGSGDTPTPSPTYIFIMPTQQSGSGSTCSCASDTLNCPDFPDDPSAQRCMDYCISVGAGDIHNLDGDANGLACDGTP